MCSLFYCCNFKFASGSGGALYPSVPSGYIYLTNTDTLQSNYATAFPTITNTFTGCNFGDPKFNNSAICDFSLAFDSPAKNLSYFGTYVGSRSITYPIKASVSESSGNFEFASSVNLIIADDSIQLINTALDAQIDTNVIVNTIGRNLASFRSFWL